MYDLETINDLHLKSREYYAKCFELQEKFILLSEDLSPHAKEHAIFGISRRLRSLRECMKLLFEILPPELDHDVNNDIQAQCDAYLHSFIINCCGITDNIAWLLAFHIKLDEKINLVKKKNEVGLFHRKFKKHLPENLLNKVEEFRDWYKFIVEQRHPIAHRIPPYIIPYTLHLGDNMKDYTPRYIHSHVDGRPVYLHAQLVADLGAILTLLDSLLIDIEGINA